MEQFTNLYSLDKTIDFGLDPQGKTLENIIKSGLLQEDEIRAQHYKVVKTLIDKYHKTYIDGVLSSVVLPVENKEKLKSLEEYALFYTNKDCAKELETVQKNLRKIISDSLTSTEKYKSIDKKELIQRDLFSIATTQEEKEALKDFQHFTVYFKGLNENRKNMYSPEAQTTSIANRLINQNLARFIDNISAFKGLMNTSVASQIPDLYKNLSEHISDYNIDELFSLQGFNQVLTQKGIDTYNAIIGGKTAEGREEKIKGLNELINLYNQQQTSNATKLSQFVLLYKQILSDKTSISWLPEEFNDDNEMLQAINKCFCELKERVLSTDSDSLSHLLKHLADYDISKIFIANDDNLTSISNKVYGYWNTINSALKEICIDNNPRKKRETDEKYNKRIDDIMKKAQAYSIAQIENAITQYGSDDVKKKSLINYFKELGAIEDEERQKENVFFCINNAYANAIDLLTAKYPEKRRLSQDKNNVFKIKTLLDALKDLQNFVAPLLSGQGYAEKDERFYGDLCMLWDELDTVTPLYNKVRNRMTQKAYSIKKIKLNFRNPTLLDGWDLNKERDNTSIILRKGSYYYLAIMDKRHNQIFDTEYLPNDGDCYEKMEYKSLPGPNKMLPKVFFSNLRIKEFNPSDKLLENYHNGTHKKGDNFNIKDCHALIDFFKASIKKHEDWSKMDFNFSPTESYDNISNFYREVEHQAYKISFRKVSISYIDDMVEKGYLYLFKIYNKDFSSYSKGTPNMHTLYWNMLFDQKNLENVVYKLNGEAEVFYRQHSIEKENRIVHTQGMPIDNKNFLNRKKQSTFAYDIIKDKRYTVDTFQFHVPITLNFKAIGQTVINGNVNQYIRECDDLHIIGIDRGERNLLYLSLIDLKGNVIEHGQYSFNTIDSGQGHKTDYHHLLVKQEGYNLQARKNWDTIEGIKDLKAGFLSQVVHQIAQLMVKYHAIVALEDLNYGFKNSRKKIERQVYQKFEKALIDKLNYLVDKKEDPDKPGGLLHALQLTNQFKSFSMMRGQNGFLFYVPAWMTSKIDPVTGFVNMLYPKYESIDKARVFFCKFQKIRYNDAQDYFEFTFDYNDFGGTIESSRTLWTICTYGDRIYEYRDPQHNNEWTTKPIQLTQTFKELFNQYEIDLHRNLKEQIASQDSRDFFENLCKYLSLTLQMRNSQPNSDIDYLISPVASPDGTFFDSRKAEKGLPENADANGAYNIARKCLWTIQQIKSSNETDKIKYISRNEWLQYAQEWPHD